MPPNIAQQLVNNYRLLFEPIVGDFELATVTSVHIHLDIIISKE